MSIKSFNGKVSNIIDLSPTAREITFDLDKSIDFIPGSFVNIFVDIDGKKTRRAYSISSDSCIKDKLSISVRRAKNGVVSGIFWGDNILQSHFSFMGPLGTNTIDKFKNDKVFLFAYGIGISVIKSILHDLVRSSHVAQIYIITGNRNEGELLYKDLLDEIAHKDQRVVSKFVLSDPIDAHYPHKGYIQDHVSDLDFNDSDIYICGPTKACESLVAEITSKNPSGTNILVEKFG